MKRTWLLINLLLLSGCATPVTPPPARSPLATVVPRISPLPTPELSRDASVQRAIKNLAARLGLEASEIKVVRTESIELQIPDRDCLPEEIATPTAVIPAQMIGLEIELTARGQRYRYHAHGAVLTLCANP